MEDLLFLVRSGLYSNTVPLSSQVGCIDECNAQFQEKLLPNYK